MPEKYKIVEIKSDAQDEASVRSAQLILETDDGFVIHCDSDFPNEPLGDLSKEELVKYQSNFLEGNVVFLAYSDTIEKNSNSDRKLEQKQGTYETEISGEVISVHEHDKIVHFEVDTGKFTFSLESKKHVFHPKEGEHVRAKGDLRIEDIKLL